MGCSPFLLGLLIGDGCFRAKSILLAACDTLIAERARREAFGLGLKLRQRSASRAGDYEVTTTRGGRNFLKTFLELQGLWGKGSRDKFVPPAVMKSPDEDIREFLSGLYAADGTITKQGRSYMPHRPSSLRKAFNTSWIASPSRALSITSSPPTPGAWSRRGDILRPGSWIS